MERDTVVIVIDCLQKTHDGVLASVENGQMKKLRENVTGINYVAVDWVGGNVLYTVRCKYRVIR